MDLDEEFNIFDDCDELFDFSDTEICAGQTGQTNDKEYNDLVLWLYFYFCKFDLNIFIGLYKFFIN